MKNSLALKQEWSKSSGGTNSQFGTWNKYVYMSQS